MKSRRVAARIAVFAGLLLMFSAGIAGAKTLYVETWGENGLSCGSRTAPCSSISYAAVVQAKRNDRILVGPGVYDVSLGINNGINGPLEGLRIESRGGRHVTFLRAGADGVPMMNVIQPRVRIGRRHKGFTFLLENGGDTATQGVRFSLGNAQRGAVEGNAFVGGPEAINATGSRHSFRFNRFNGHSGIAITCTECDHARITDNAIHNSNEGIGLEASERVLVQRNRILGTSSRGIFFMNGTPGARIYDNVVMDSGSAAITAWALDGYKIRGNIVNGSGGSGIFLDQDGNAVRSSISNNMVVGSANVGLYLQNTDDSRVERNSLVQNDDIGIEVALGTIGSLVRNNTWENDHGGNGIGLAAGVSPVPYKRHFFGDPSGPDQDLDTDSNDAVALDFPENSTSASRPTTTGVSRAAKL